MVVIARTVAVAALVAAAVACGGGPPGPRTGARSTAPLGFADPATIRGLLARYAPNGHAIVTAYEALPTRFELPEGPYEVSSSDTFDGYLGDGALELLVGRVSTAVHELTHGYASRMGFQLLAERALPYGDGAEAILGDGEPWLVRYTATYPAVELDATFPADARTARYAIYVAPGTANQATQVVGVYGLLDELTASYQDARVTVGFWPWVRDAAPADARLVMNYAVGLDDLQRAYADFSLYILHYLIHARTHRPDVYQALVGNDAFRRAFLEVHDAYAVLVAAVAALEPTVHAFARTRGVALERRDGQLVIDGAAQRADEAAAVRAVRAHLDDDAYRAALAALR